MTKSEVATALMEKVPVGSKRQATEIVDAVFTIVLESLIENSDFRYSDFGTFKVEQRKERMGRNPHTGGEVLIPAKKVVKFKPAPAMLRSVQ